MPSPAAVNAAKRRAAQRGRRGLVRRAPVIHDPRGLASSYRGELLGYVRALHKEVQETLIAALPMLATERDAMRLDAWDETVTRLIDGLTVFGRRRGDDVIRGLNRRAEDVSSWNRAQLNRAIRSVIGVDLFGGADAESLQISLRSWARENASLITNITEKTMTDIDGITQRAMRSGSNPRDIAREIQRTMKTTEARAKLIARDQISKLNGDLTKQRNEALGIERYIWSTSGDERVRDSHRVMNGKLCRWDDESVYSDDGGKTWQSRSSIGGYVGHPSDDYQCRCVSSPDLSDVLADAGIM